MLLAEPPGARSRRRPADRRRRLAADEAHAGGDRHRARGGLSRLALLLPFARREDDRRASSRCAPRSPAATSRWPSPSACCCSATGRPGAARQAAGRGPRPCPQGRGRAHGRHLPPAPSLSSPVGQGARMEGPVAVDGGDALEGGSPSPLRHLRSPRPALAQDPLAPLGARRRAAAGRRSQLPRRPPVSSPRSSSSRATGAACSPRSAAATGHRRQAGIAALPPAPLTPLARAELYTARDSPAVDLCPAPGAARRGARAAAGRAAGAHGADPRRDQPPLIVGRAAGRQPRLRARPLSRPAGAGEPPPTSCAPALDPFVKANDAAGAEALVHDPRAALSLEARAEAGQRVAWIYYVLGLDLDARRVADTCAPGATGEWAAAGGLGLRAWRRGGSTIATRAARASARSPPLPASASFAPAAYYWAARAEQACRRPRSVAPLLRAAAQSPESFYGLLARETLGIDTRCRPTRAGIDRRRRAAAQRPPRGRAGAHRRARAGRGTAPPPGADRLAGRASRPDPGRQAARPRRRAVVARDTMASAARGSTPPTAIPSRAGRRSAAGGSIRRSPSATSSRNRPSGRTRSARPARSA